MRLCTRLCSVLIVAGYIGDASATDACSTTAVKAAADVSVSDGSSFRTESYFHSADQAAIRHIGETDQIIVVEGPLSWVRVGEEAEAGSEFHKLFALGHQYHALLLHFDQVAGEPRDTERVSLGGEEQRARSGDYPYGGIVHLVESAAPGRPAGLKFEFPDIPPIEVTFSDWQQHGDTELPYLATIDDGERVFNYHYTNIEIAADSPLWFHKATGTPALDELEVYRLHRRLLAAHCLGDAGLMTQLSAESVVSANNGKLTQASRESMRERFTGLFERVNYTEYHDIAAPVIEVADSSDIGWIAVNVRAVGAEIATGESFDTQWAWLMTVRKVDGEWLHAGNASNVVR